MGLNIGALGNFAGGVAKGMTAYQEQALREKDAEMRREQLEIEKEKQAWAAREQEDKEAYRRIMGLSTSPEGEAGSGVPLQEAIKNLGVDINANPAAVERKKAPAEGLAKIFGTEKVSLEEKDQYTPPEFTEAGRRELLAKLQTLPPEQAAKILQAYQSMYTKPDGGVDIGKVALYKSADGQLMATDKTVARTPEQQMIRLQELAKQSGNPYALDKAMDLETKQKQNKMADINLSKAEREEKYGKALEELSNKQIKMLETVENLSQQGLEGAPEILNGELKGFGLTAKFVPATTVQSEAPTAFSMGKTALGSPAVVEVRDKKGNVVGSFGSVEEIQGALESHMEDYNKKLAGQIANLLPNPQDRLKFFNDVKTLNIEQAKLVLQGRQVAQGEAAGERDALRIKQDDLRIAQGGAAGERDEKRIEIERDRVKQEDRKIDALFQQVGFEGERLKLLKEQVGFEASRLGIDAGKLGLEWAKFNLEVKDNPTRVKVMEAQIKNYNADANYRNAAAKNMGEKSGNWSVIGVDKDGAPISYNKNDGKAARADGQPIQDVEIFKKITGEKAPKDSKLTEQLGRAYAEDIQMAKSPEEITAIKKKYSALGLDTGYVDPVTGTLPKTGENLNPEAAKNNKSAVPVDSRPKGNNVNSEVQSQAANRLYAAEVFLREAEKEAQAAAASGDKQVIIAAGNKLNAARAARDEAASSSFIPR